MLLCECGAAHGPSCFPLQKRRVVNRQHRLTIVLPSGGVKCMTSEPSYLKWVSLQKRCLVDCPRWSNDARGVKVGHSSGYQKRRSHLLFPR